MNQGIYGIYKKSGPTSHDIIKELRRITGIKKIGHAGTLDPRASGVLVVGIGREATRQLSRVVEKEKEYLAGIKLGETSATFDNEGAKTREKTKVKISRIPDLIRIKSAVAEFIGKIKQTPPQYSAVKIKGRPAYKYAREGKFVEIRPRRVEIRKITILKYHWPILKIKVVCGPGVYIRSLAHDIGKELKTGGYLANLERTRVGDFTKDKSLTIEKLSQIWQDKR